LIPLAPLRTDLDWLIREGKLQAPRGWRSDRAYDWPEREWFIALMRVCGVDAWPQDEARLALECALRDREAAKEHWEAGARYALNKKP
jgi:hypothetical protein